MKVCAKVGAKVCGQKSRKNLKLWLNTKLEEIKKLQELITQLTRHIEQGIPNAREERKDARKRYNAKKLWERE